MKLCLASMAPFMGGAEIALERLSLGLLEEGHDVFLVLGARNAVFERFMKLGLRCFFSPMYFTDRWHLFRYWSARKRIRRLIVREAPDIVHSNDLPTHQIISDATRGTGIPRICHHRFVYDHACLDWLNKFGGERHIFISHSLMEDLTTQSLRLHSSERAVVHDGLPLPTVPSSEERNQARKKLGLPLDRVIVLFAGQIIELKGVEDLLLAWSLLPERVRACSDLLFVGEDLQKQGAYRRTMETKARELGCSARFLGFQQHVQEWQMACDIAAVPSRVEPLGLVVLEAMSLGVPVVACSVGGIRETVVDGQTGLLVPPRSPDKLAEALARLIVDADLRQRLGEQGRRRCEEQFSLQAHVRAVVKQYNTVLSPSRSATVS